MPRKDRMHGESRRGVGAWWALLGALVRALGPNRVVVLRGCRCNWNWAREEGTGQDNSGSTLKENGPLASSPRTR